MDLNMVGAGCFISLLTELFFRNKIKKNLSKRNFLALIFLKMFMDFLYLAIAAVSKNTGLFFGVSIGLLLGITIRIFIVFRTSANKDKGGESDI